MIHFVISNSLHYLQAVYKNKIILIFMVVALSLFSCKKEAGIEDGNKTIQLSMPKGFPYPDIPPDNLLTQNRIDLGKKLFFDPILSRDSTVSCGSCHQTDKFFTDNLQFSTGIEGRLGIRNAPSLINVAYQPNMFWDGGVPTLEQQVLAPISNHLEFDFDANKIVERLKKHPTYPMLFQKAYSQEPSIFAFTRAIACYERTLIGGKSRYDKFIQDKDSSALSVSEMNGMKIFFGENGECFHCHQGFTLTDYSFRNNGLYLVYPDSGRAKITLQPSDIGKFKVPSLRNVEKTAPYMHDGSLATLEDVIAHYVSGGKKHPNKSSVIQPLNLNDQEKQDLINFLKSLTDE